MTSLFVAYSVVWGLIFGYTWFLARRQKDLERRIEDLRRELKDRKI